MENMQGIVLLIVRQKQRGKTSGRNRNCSVSEIHRLWIGKTDVKKRLLREIEHLGYEQVELTVGYLS